MSSSLSVWILVLTAVLLPLVSGPLMAGDVTLQPPQGLDAEEIKSLVGALTQAKTADLAKGHAEKLRTGGKAARAALFRLALDAKTVLAARDGVLQCLEGVDDRAPDVLSYLCRGLVEPDVQLAPRARALILRLHAAESVVPGLLAEAVKRGGAGRRAILDLAVQCVAAGSDDDRRSVTESLIGYLEGGAKDEEARQLEELLEKLTLHSGNRGAAAWRAWLEDYDKKFPGDFGLPSLARDAVARVEARRDREVMTAHRKGIDLLVAAGELPLEYLDAEKMRFVGVRIHAAESLPRAAGADAEKQKRCVARLLKILAEDEPVELTGAALKALPAFLEKTPAFGKEVAEAVLARNLLAEGAQVDLVGPAVEVLRASRFKGAGQAIANLYRRLLAREDRGRERLACISALYSLKDQEKTIVDALKDPNREVQAASAGSLRLLGNPAYAPDLGRALSDGVDPENVEVFVTALRKLGNYADADVIKGLRRIAASKPETKGRQPAVATLLVARLDGKVPEDQVEDVDAQLLATYPQTLASTEAREALVAEAEKVGFKAAPELGAKWCTEEPDAGLRQRLAVLVAASEPATLSVLTDLAAQLVAGEHREAAASVLEAIVVRSEKATDPAEQLALSPARRSLAAILLHLRASKGLTRADGLLTAELETAADDGALLRQRGRVRDALNRNDEALADLTRGLSLDAATLPAAERHETHRLIASIHHRKKEPGKAREEIEKIPDTERSRATKILLATVHASLEQHREAHDLATELLRDRKDNEATLLQIQIDAALALPDPAARAALPEALIRLGPLTTEAAREAVGARIQADTALREAVASLDSAADDAATAPLLEQLAKSEDPLGAATWLTNGLDALAKKGTPEASRAVHRRLQALRRVYPKEAALQKLELPTNGERDGFSYDAQAAAALAWWKSHTAAAK